MSIKSRHPKQKPYHPFRLNRFNLIHYSFECSHLDIKTFIHFIASFLTIARLKKPFVDFGFGYDSISGSLECHKLLN